jgi:uncharacterized membrane protein YfcA
VGLLLMAYGAYALVQPALGAITFRSRAGDGVVGVVGGVLGGATGLVGIAAAIWCTMRGWTKDEQRAVFQPVAVVTFVMVALGYLGARVTTGRVVLLFVLGLPALAIGNWLGFRLYDRLDEQQFRRVVALVLLLSGVGLVLQVTAR